MNEGERERERIIGKGRRKKKEQRSVWHTHNLCSICSARVQRDYDNESIVETIIDQRENDGGGGERGGNRGVLGTRRWKFF